MTDLNIDNALIAAADAVWHYVQIEGTPHGLARAAVEAALPHIRAALADEIEAQHPRCTYECPMCDAYDETIRIIRGEDA